jgi:hypothetical protein
MVMRQKAIMAGYISGVKTLHEYNVVTKLIWETNLERRDISSSSLLQKLVIYPFVAG